MKSVLYGGSKVYYLHILIFYFNIMYDNINISTGQLRVLYSRKIGIILCIPIYRIKKHSQYRYTYTQYRYTQFYILYFILLKCLQCLIDIEDMNTVMSTLLDDVSRLSLLYYYYHYYHYYLIMTQLLPVIR